MSAHRPVRAVAVAALALGLALTTMACGSSAKNESGTPSGSSTEGTTSGTNATSGTTSGTSGTATATDAVQKGILVVVESSDSYKVPTQPDGFLACVAGKLSSADRAVVAKITDSAKVPSNVEVRAMRAANSCNRTFLISVFKGQVTGTNGLPGITDSQATCASTKTIDAIVGLDDKTIGTGTDSKEGTAAVSKALDECYPASSFLTAELKQQSAGITDAQISCIEGKVDASSLSWSDIQSDSFQTKLQDATSACGVGS